MFTRSSRQQRQLNVARELFEFLAQRLNSRISIRLWDGSVIPLGANPCPGLELSIRSPGVIGSLLRRPTPENLLRHYARGAIDYHGSDLLSLIHTARVRDSRKRTRGLPWGLLARVLMAFITERSEDLTLSHQFTGDDTGQTRNKADNRDYIQFHYDVSNEFYQLFLDSEMVYSCAYFRDWNHSLEQAQQDKLDMICRKLQLKPGERLLDIGCGWGALICHAARHYGVHAHGITLSQEQLTYTRAKIDSLGLQDRVTAELCDYADVEGSFDKVSSIGMVEHVGIANLPAYMQKVRSLLPERGIFLNHGITRPAKTSRRKFRRHSPERRLLTKYIFPGGELDHQGHMIECMEAAGFEVHDVEGWRDHYGLTCQHWSQRLEANREEAIRLVGVERYRMWQLYLAGVSLALADGTARIFQTVATNRMSKGHSRMPATREHLYGAPRDVRRAA